MNKKVPKFAFIAEVAMMVHKPLNVNNISIDVIHNNTTPPTINNGKASVVSSQMMETSFGSFFTKKKVDSQL